MKEATFKDIWNKVQKGTVSAYQKQLTKKMLAREKLRKTAEALLKDAAQHREKANALELKAKKIR